MSGKPFHLGWFLQGSSVQAWGYPWTGHIGTTWRKPDLFVDMAKSLERSCFDYILIEDTSYVAESFGGTNQIYLHHGISAPRQDPSVVATLMTAATSRIGIIPTFGTYAFHPYIIARLIGTLDQVSDGRIGWNVVTGSSDFAARNFGMPGMPEHDLRYDMADEFIDCVRQLWGSWEPDAFLADTDTGVLVDHTKVKAINYEGKYYQSRGPLNSGPTVQQQPVICQAGGSPRGRAFASKHADTIVVTAKGVPQMKAYREEIRARMVEHGRDPDSCKILFLISPIFGQTAGEVAERKRIYLDRIAAEVPQRLAFFSKITNIDFSVYDLDSPVADLTTNGNQHYMDLFKKSAKGKTLRQVMLAEDTLEECVELVGTMDEVAARMGEVMEEVGGDGFLFAAPNVSRRLLAEIEDGLVPALQKRGLTRKAYEHAHLRDNLLAF